MKYCKADQKVMTNRVDDTSENKRTRLKKQKGLNTNNKRKNAAFKEANEDCRLIAYKR
jgi:hypothetical protein